MRQSFLSLMGAVLALAPAWAQTETPAVTSATLDESEVRITYGELKRLLAATLPIPPPQVEKPRPPLPAALRAVLYRFDASAGTIIAEVQVENFDGGWHAVPIAGAGAAAIGVEPGEAGVVIRDEHLCLMTGAVGAQTVKLTYAIAPEGQGTTLRVAASPVAALEVKALPEGKVLRIAHDNATHTISQAGTWSLPATGADVTFAIEEARKAAASTVGVTTDDAVISTATYTTQVVRDGSVLTEGTLIARHDQAAKLIVRLPEGAKLLQCDVNAEPMRPVMGEGGRMEIPLNDPATDGAESQIKLSFTGVVAALQPAEGELDLALPQTPLFARQIDWNVQLPPNYDLSFSGNVDAVTDQPPAAGIQLRKSLSRDQQPQARIIYRKRSGN